MLSNPIQSIAIIVASGRVSLELTLDWLPIDFRMDGFVENFGQVAVRVILLLENTRKARWPEVPFVCSKRNNVNFLNDLCIFCQNLGIFRQNLGIFCQNLGIFSKILVSFPKSWYLC